MLTIFVHYKYSWIQLGRRTRTYYCSYFRHVSRVRWKITWRTKLVECSWTFVQVSCSIASFAERSFSTLRRLKNYLILTRPMTQERLNHVAVHHVHKTRVNALDINKTKTWNFHSKIRFWSKTSSMVHEACWVNFPTRDWNLEASTVCWKEPARCVQLPGNQAAADHRSCRTSRSGGQPKTHRSTARCTKCNSWPINCQCTNFILFDVAL